MYISKSYTYILYVYIYTFICFNIHIHIHTIYEMCFTSAEAGWMLPCLTGKVFKHHRWVKRNCEGLPRNDKSKGYLCVEFLLSSKNSTKQLRIFSNQTPIWKNMLIKLDSSSPNFEWTWKTIWVATTWCKHFHPTGWQDIPPNTTSILWVGLMVGNVQFANRNM